MSPNDIRRAQHTSRWHGLAPPIYYVETWDSPRLVCRFWRAILG